MNYLIAVVGPTAIGKTALGITLARHFNTEIISCDSRQFFKETYIGTAVPEPEELAAVPHHFIQNLSIHTPYSVGDFERDALVTLQNLFTKNNVVVMVGGSGLYVDAVTKGLDNFPTVDETIRTRLNQQLATEGLAPLQQQLATLDPLSYQEIAIDNPQRVIRALEICLGTGKPYSSFKNQAKNKRDFTTITVGLIAERAIIYERINHRVLLMMKKGLLTEAQQLFTYKHLNALQTVGYKELFEYLDGKISLDFAVSEIQKNTRRFAKRQLTWFKKNPNTLWFDYQTPATTIVAQLVEKIK